MKEKRFSFLVITLVIFLLGSYSPAYSQGNLRFDFLELHPFVKSSGVFTDNIHQTEEDKKNAFITTFSPGLEIRIPTTWHLVGLEYHNDLHFISNLDQSRENHFASANLDLNFPGGFYLKAGECYLQSIYPDSNEETGLVGRSRNDALFEFGYKLVDRWVVKGGYGNTIHNYQSSEANDRIEHKGIIAFSLRALSRASLFTEVHGGTIKYKNTPEGNGNAVFLNGFFGAQGQLASKTNLLLKIGLQHRSYEQAEGSDFTKFIANLSLRHKLSSYMSLTIAASQDVAESSWSSNYYYTSNNVELGINHKFLRKFSAVLNYAYGLNKYHEDELLNETSEIRQDTIMSLSFNLLCEVQRWINLCAGYCYRNRDSNFPFDYYENRISLTATAVY